IDALETELPRPLDTINRHAPVPGIAEVDRTAGMDTDVVRAVEFLVLEMRGEHLAASVRPLHLFDGRLTSTTPRLASQRRRTSPGMSENNKYWSRGCQIGPSVNSK